MKSVRQACIECWHPEGQTDIVDENHHFLTNAEVLTLLQELVELRKEKEKSLTSEYRLDAYLKGSFIRSFSYFSSVQEAEKFAEDLLKHADYTSFKLWQKCVRTTPDWVNIPILGNPKPV